MSEFLSKRGFEGKRCFLRSVYLPEASPHRVPRTTARGACSHNHSCALCTESSIYCVDGHREILQLKAGSQGGAITFLWTEIATDEAHGLIDYALLRQWLLDCYKPDQSPGGYVM